MAVKAKRCPLCGGKPRYVHYAVPRTVCPDAWELTETGLEPMMTYKRIECEDCGASTMMWIQCDDLLTAWNQERIMEFVYREPVLEVEDAAD